MKKIVGLSFIIAIGFAAPALADLKSVRPLPRPEQVEAAPGVAPAGTETIRGTEGRGAVRPQPRPEMSGAAEKQPAKGFLGKLFGPPKTAKTAQPQKQKEVAAPLKGSVCDDRAIRGTAIAPIRSKTKGCGIENPVRVTAIDGVTLNTPATLSCEAAIALRKWVSNEVKPAFGASNIVGLRLGSHYACRPRNNKRGARISEHGRGKAIDITGFFLANGTELTVKKHYKSNQGKAMRSAHKGACGIFGTTLGPGSDGYHGDNLHFDTARYRGGPYCK